jgi:hypothetical protein
MQRLARDIANISRLLEEVIHSWVSIVAGEAAHAEVVLAAAASAQ